MKGKKIILFAAEVAIFSALALALDFICGLYLSFAWLNGGSISIAMVPIFIMCYRWGPKGGFLTALLTGFGVFDKIAQKCGAGTFIPISGFE